MNRNELTVGTPGPRSRCQRARLEMDGAEHQHRYGLPEQNLGFTSVLVTTHRQNFLLSSRAHRSMPLAEML